MKILVVDDEAVIRMGLRRMLSEHGHVVSLARNGKDALQVARREQPDIVLLDIRMPLTNGFDCARALHKMRPVPIVMVTANADAQMIEKAANLPIHGYVVKPVHEPALLAAIAIAVKRFEDQQSQGKKLARVEERLETRKLVDRAKGILIGNGMSEEESYLHIQKLAREARTNMREIAEQILSKAQ